MPTFDIPDPLSAGADVAGSYLQSRNTERDKAAELARAQEKEQYDRGVQQKQLSLEEQRTESELQHNKLQDQIAQAEEETRQKLAPIVQKQQELQVQLQTKQITGEEFRNKAAGLDLQSKQFQNYLDKKYGEQTARIALQQGMANVAHTQAETGLDSAETAHEKKLTSLEGTTGYGTGSASDRATAAYEQAITALSPQGQKFYDMIFSGNNPPTRAQAMLALSRSALNAADKRNLATIITNKDSSFVTPGSQQAAARTAATAAQKPGQREFQTVKENMGFQALPADQQVFLEQGIEAYSYDGAIKHLKAIATGQSKGSVTAEQAASMLGALGAQ